jgi:Zn-dependent protease
VLWQIMVVNLILFGLNMLPVQPLDGGKLFHLMLIRVLPAEVALKIAGFVGLIIAVLWIPGMLAAWFYFGIFLLFFPPIGLHLEMIRGK